MDDGTPSQPVDDPLKVDHSAKVFALDSAVRKQLWEQSDAQSWGLTRDDFDRIILTAALRQDFGLASGPVAGREEQAAFFRGLKVADLTLAAACAEGNERAWEHFMALYGAQLTRAAIAISGSETVGRDLADTFYAELYGLKTQDGVRKCPLASYRGRGSLLGWLRTTLSQRFVDHYRRTFREEALDDQAHDLPAAENSARPDATQAAALQDAMKDALGNQPAEDRFLLAAYYLDERTLAEIGRLLNVHEATVSRRLKRATEEVRKDLVRKLEKAGMSRRAALEALGTDPRDLELGMDLKKLLQQSSEAPFSYKETSEPVNQPEKRGEPAVSGAAASQASGVGGER